MAAIAADRDLLFGLLALQNGLIDQGQLVAAFQAWTRDKARPLAEHLVARGDLDADAARRRRGPGRRCTSKKHGGDAEKSLAAIPAGRSTRESLAAARRPRRSSATLGHVGSRPRPDRTATPTARPATPSARPPATASGSASCGPTPAAAWAPSSWPSTPSCNREVALKQILDQHADDPTSRAAVPARGRDHRRAGAPGDRPGLRPGHLRRRPALLRHAVHQGRQPQGGHRPLPRRRGARRPTPAGGRWSCASCCGGSPTSATRSTTRTAGACCTATSSRATSSSASTARRWWSTGGWPRPLGRAEPGADPGERTLVPVVGQRVGRDAAGQRAGDAGLHEPRAGRGRPGAPGAAVATSTAWARRSTAC